MLNQPAKRSLIILVALVAANFSIASVSAVPKEVGRFQPILAELQQKTDVPIVIPAQLPTEVYTISPEGVEPTNPNPSVSPFFPHVTRANSSRYYISLDVAAECSSSGACDQGFISGKKITSDMPDISKQFADLVQLHRSDSKKLPLIRSPEKPTRVQLAGGITGYFFPFSCGANCSNSVVVWDQNGYRYRVGLEMGRKESVVNLANSAIQNQK